MALAQLPDAGPSTTGGPRHRDVTNITIPLGSNPGSAVLYRSLHLGTRQ